MSPSPGRAGYRAIETDKKKSKKAEDKGRF